MITKIIQPPISIANYVSGILVIESQDHPDDFILPLYANGSPTIVFQTTPAAKQDRTIGHLVLYGQTILPGELSFTGNFTLIAYFLLPHALKTLFGMYAGELTDGYIDLHTIKQARETNLQEQLLNAATLHDRLQLIDDFLLKRSSGLHNTPDKRIIFATSTLQKGNSIHLLTDLQRQLNITERSLQRLFETHVGISPKMYKRICQFQGAFQQLNQYEFSKLTDVAFDHGFADQSHYIRVFKEFTGITPKAYLAKRAPYNPKF
jgi:AraC-like DNA-binding protein